MKHNLEQYRCSDISYLPTKEGWLYLAVVLDLHSRLVVGWAMGERLTADFPLAALGMVLGGRCPTPGLVHHDGRGSRCTSRAYRRPLEGAGCAGKHA